MTPEQQDVTLTAENTPAQAENKVSGNSAQSKVMVKGTHSESGSGDGVGKVELVVQSNIAGVVRKITKDFKKYSKGLKNVKIDINSSPVVLLDKPVVTGPKLDMKSSVTGGENGSSNKKIKIYVDDELQMERELMKIANAPGDPTKGPEIG